MRLKNIYFGKTNKKKSKTCVIDKFFLSSPMLVNYCMRLKDRNDLSSQIYLVWVCKSD